MALDLSTIPVTIIQQEALLEPPRYLSTLAFDNRFTAVERAMIDLASIDTPTDTQEKRMGAAMIRVWLQRATKATFIDPTRADTRAGVLGLEGMGLLTEGRALEILDTPISDDELYRGIISV